jgi:hypothetical protein
LVDRFLGRFNQGGMQTRLSALTPFRLCGKVGSAEVAVH